jgi:hypothetical protein
MVIGRPGQASRASENAGYVSNMSAIPLSTHRKSARRAGVESHRRLRSCLKKKYEEMKDTMDDV